MNEILETEQPPLLICAGQQFINKPIDYRHLMIIGLHGPDIWLHICGQEKVVWKFFTDESARLVYDTLCSNPAHFAVSHRITDLTT